MKMMGQQQTVVAGSTLRRIATVVLVAALMALTMAASAVPALAVAPQGQEGKDNGQCQKFTHKDLGIPGHVTCVFLP
jgi:hypothetical protein